MIECPVCMELDEFLVYDQDHGDCCSECSQHFDNKRAEHDDNMRKLWKSGEIDDEEYDNYVRNERMER